MNVNTKNFFDNAKNGDISSFTEEEIKHCFSIIDLSLIPDRYIAKKEEYYKNINFDNVDKMKKLRILSINPYIKHYINISNIEYDKDEVKRCVMLSPSITKELNIDFGNLTKKDIIELSRNKNKYLKEKVDLEKYDFKISEAYDIIKENEYDEKTIETFDIYELSDFHTAEIIKKTGDKYIDKLNVDILTPKKWIEILKEYPYMLKYIDVKIFEDCDIFYAVEFLTIFPKEEYYYLITNRNYFYELSAYGWERLIVSNPDFIEKCNYTKLNESNWNNIIKHNPDLEVFKI